jgi:hypothetical protein
MRQASPHRGVLRFLPAMGVVTIATSLAAWAATITIIATGGVPIGADAPVYVWWARLVGHSGSSVVAMRPGVPNVVELVARATGIPEQTAVASFECALVALIGMSGCAALRASGEREGRCLTGLALTGVFGTYLAAGHLSNAAFAALFVLAIAFLIDGRKRSTVASVLIIGGAGLAHPEFSWLAIAILAGAASIAAIAGSRREAINTAAVAGAGAGVTGLGLIAARFGGPPFDVPTSLDVFLMQTHQLSRLHDLFLERFRPKVATYALWAWVPVALFATPRLHSRLGRVLVSWCAVTVVGVLVGLLWQPFPPHRIVAFAFCLPLLASLGIGVIADRIPRLAAPITAIVLVATVASATMLWIGAPRPYEDPIAADAVAVEPEIARTSGTVIVDLPPGTNGTGVAVIRATNLLRSAAPPDRIRDLIVRFPEPAPGDADGAAVWQDTEDRIRALGTTGPVTELALPVGIGVVPATPMLSLVAGIAGWIAMCAVAGLGWCLATGQRGIRLLERSLGTGLAALIWGSSVADLLGVRLGQRSDALFVFLAVVASGGIAAIATRAGQGKPDTSTTAQVPARHLSLNRSGTA